MRDRRMLPICVQLSIMMWESISPECCAVKFGRTIKQETESDQAIAVGRVMTYVLAMVVELERLIRESKPTAFYGVSADIDRNAVWKAVEGFSSL